MYTEDKFEEIIEKELLQISGYQKSPPADYDPETALFPSQILNFIQQTQRNQWERFANTTSDPQKIIIESLIKELKS
jgi:type I restriction enzyme R subunit